MDRMTDIERRESVDVQPNTPAAVESIDASIDLAEVGIEAPNVAEKKEGTSENKAVTAKTSSAIPKDDNVVTKTAFSIHNPPPRKVMKMQIEKQLKEDIRLLNKQVKKVMTSKKTNAKELQDLVARLRKLREYLKDLAYMTLDRMKHLWVKIVQKEG